MKAINHYMHLARSPEGSVLTQFFFIASYREINNAVLKAEIAFEVYKDITGEIGTLSFYLRP